jgi:hypothetical protein
MHKFNMKRLAAVAESRRLFCCSLHRQCDDEGGDVGGLSKLQLTVASARQPPIQALAICYLLSLRLLRVLASTFRSERRLVLPYHTYGPCTLQPPFARKSNKSRLAELALPLEAIGTDMMRASGPKLTSRRHFL